MGQFDLNLSTRPFKPYRVANLGLFALLMVLVAVSIFQIYSYQRYSTMAANSRQEEKLKRQEADLLNEQTRELNLKMNRGNASAKLSEVEQLNQLLVRKSFSWTRVLSTLEGLVPEDARLVSLQPLADQEGRIFLNMNVRGRTLADANNFLKALETSKAFGDVALAIEEKKDSVAGNEVQFTLSAYYTPDGGSK
jgi:Tfp pilus assembly protein PilN